MEAKKGSRQSVAAWPRTIPPPSLLRQLYEWRRTGTNMLAVVVEGGTISCAPVSRFRAGLTGENKTIGDSLEAIGASGNIPVLVIAENAFAVIELGPGGGQDLTDAPAIASTLGEHVVKEEPMTETAPGSDRGPVSTSAASSLGDGQATKSEPEAEEAPSDEHDGKSPTALGRPRCVLTALREEMVALFDNRPSWLLRGEIQRLHESRYPGDDMLIVEADHDYVSSAKIADYRAGYLTAMGLPHIQAPRLEAVRDLGDIPVLLILDGGAHVRGVAPLFSDGSRPWRAA